MQEKIKITFPDGKAEEFDKGITPFAIAEIISKKFAKEVIVAELNGKKFEKYE